jgi:hypothetical protein
MSTGSEQSQKLIHTTTRRNHNQLVTGLIHGKGKATLPPLLSPRSNRDFPYNIAPSAGKFGS